jgi:hypothetical protein
VQQAYWATKGISRIRGRWNDEDVEVLIEYLMERGERWCEEMRRVWATKGNIAETRMK